MKKRVFGVHHLFVVKLEKLDNAKTPIKISVYKGVSLRSTLPNMAFVGNLAKPISTALHINIWWLKIVSILNFAIRHNFVSTIVPTHKFASIFCKFRKLR